MPTTAGIVQANCAGDFSPSPSFNFKVNTQGDTTLANSDYAGNTAIRGQVLSDEGSFYDDFSSSSWATAITGTVKFTPGSTSVTGSGTLFKSELNKLYHIKLDADAETTWARIAQVISDTELILSSPYTGSSTAGATSKSYWITQTGTGSTLAYSGSTNSVITGGTTNGSVSGFYRTVDYAPMVGSWYVNLATRSANTFPHVGFFKTIAADYEVGATVHFNTSTATTFTFRSQSAAGTLNRTETTVVMPTGFSTGSDHEYKVELGANEASLTVDGDLVAVHRLHIPDPYQVLLAGHFIHNNAGGSSTTMTVNQARIQNVDVLQATNIFQGEPQINTIAWQPSPLGGKSFALVAAGTTNATLIKSRAGSVFHVHAYNQAAAARYIKLYDKATSPTVGTDNPVITYLVPAGTSIDIDLDPGTIFTLGIGLAMTVLGTVADTTALTAGDVRIKIDYA